MAEIVLVRHGPSAHHEPRWLNAEGVRAWSVAYDAAEIRAHPGPPLALVEVSRAAAVVVSSDLPRAIASAALLAHGRAVHSDGRLREAPLEVPGAPLPGLGGLRLPLRLWALVFAVRWVWAWLRRAPMPGVDAAVLARAEAAADWLVGLAAERRVVVVTHGFFRRLVGQALERRGWSGPRRRPFGNWSEWTYRR